MILRAKPTGCKKIEQKETKETKSARQDVAAHNFLQIPGLSARVCAL
jgi:hypothetical protein